jgi:hypothetical protein
MKPVLAGLSLMTCVMGCSGGSANADSSALRTDTAKAAAGVGSSTGVTTGSASGRIGGADTLAARATPAGTGGIGSMTNPRGTGSTGAKSAVGSSRSRGSSARSTTPTDSSGRDTGVTRSDAADTARGIVAVLGTSLDSRVVVRADGGARSVTLVGAQARAIGAMSGADVWVTGTRDQNGRITVSRFTVRSVDGAPALDGTLIARGAQLLLVTRDGKQHAIDAAPPALREHVGARVWVTGPLDKGPVIFGVIEERR